MTRLEFVEKAARAAEKSLEIPPGWWGTWRDVHGPKGQRVRFSNSVWTLSLRSKLISRHDSRAFAIAKGKKL